MGQNSLEVSPTTGQWHPGRGKKKNRRKKRLLEVACYRFQRLRMEMVLAFSPSGNFPGEHQLPPLCAGQGKVQGIIARSSRKERRK
jgi:hypothetical protein